MSTLAHRLQNAVSEGHIIAGFTFRTDSEWNDINRHILNCSSVQPALAGVTCLRLQDGTEDAIFFEQFRANLWPSYQPSTQPVLFIFSPSGMALSDPLPLENAEKTGEHVAADLTLAKTKMAHSLMSQFLPMMANAASSTTSGSGSGGGSHAENAESSTATIPHPHPPAPASASSSGRAHAAAPLSSSAAPKPSSSSSSSQPRPPASMSSQSQTKPTANNPMAAPVATAAPTTPSSSSSSSSS
eukprot:Rmarinus@m.32